MRVLQLLGFFVILWQNQITVFAISDSMNDDALQVCKSKSTSAKSRLKNDLFCDYDKIIRPNHHRIITNVTIELVPYLIEIQGESFIVQTMLFLEWTDIYLTWTPNKYAGIDSIHVKSDNIWTPNLAVYNSGDMSHDQIGMPTTNCLLFNTGNVICDSFVKYISGCKADYTYFPYDKHKCELVLGPWVYSEDNIDLQIEEEGVTMSDLQNNSIWDIKFLNVSKMPYGFSSHYLNYTFSAIRHSRMKHAFQIIPVIALILLTLTVLWLDSKSVERIAVASVNFICHLLCMSDLRRQLPMYRGVNTPHILIFYRESLALATFALILTVLLRKLLSMNTEMPNWISYPMTFVLRNRIGRFLILNNKESNMSSEGLTGEENTHTPKSEFRVKESSWRHFAKIVECLSFFCVTFTYIIILIILVPRG